MYLLLLPLLAAPLAAPHGDSLPQTRVQYEPARRALTITVGPFRLPAAMEGGHDHEMMMMDGWAEDHSDLVTWPADTWLQGFQLRVVDGAGRELSRRLLHHYAVIDLAARRAATSACRRPSACPCPPATGCRPTSCGTTTPIRTWRRST